MAASITVTRNFPALTDLKLVTAVEMRELGRVARERILRRTLAGIDADGAPFVAYTPEYAELKRRVLGTTRVNLQVSGNMLNHLQVVEVTENTVTLGWNQ